MEAQRFSLVVAGAQGQADGRIVVAPSWRPEMSRGEPDSAFTIVLLTEPPAAPVPPPSSPTVAVCVPERRVRAVREVGVAYLAGREEAGEGLRLPRAAMAAYARGRILAAGTITVLPYDIFGGDPVRPRLDLLAEALARLREVAEGGAERFAACYTSPADLGEDVLLCRCLEQGVEGAQELAELRRYLSDALPPAGPSEMAADRIMTLEQLSFATLLAEPERLAGIRSIFQVFREAYRKAYLEHHRRYWEGTARLHALLEEAEPIARALARLNTLRALGPAVGRAALSEHKRLLGKTRACPRGKELEADLLERPLCPGCGLTLAASPPEEGAQEAVRRLQRALGRQQARLASEAVRQILARRGGERIERFIQIVQASDLTGLVNVLDDALLDFLAELLAPAAAPSDVLGELSRLFPGVGERNLDAAVEEFRRLLRAALDAQRREAPRRAPRVRLRPSKAPP